ncbi:YceD family protein [Flavimaricola marinus]|uniref:DUF177 domain-containing protein n=1 Tax=Flavimaricola marinus TaxID=1819565 RepID=A0A238LL05_9RHOB|nr:DUF177 domain-containing protein [Flavimaricola marinus]SMY09636.1 hypothetical protein LOM8899_03807 [Flavimaricola marinus]
MSADPSTQPNAALPQHIVRMSDLPHSRDYTFELTTTESQRQAVADVLGIVGVRKLTMKGTLIPLDRSDWRLEATLGATAVQECVVTLDPVTTRIDEKVLRVYRADLPPPEAGEIEMPEDDTEEGLPATLDLAAVMIEAVALALPAYPRKSDAEIGELVVTEPGKTPLTQSEMKPFAGLAALRAKMSDEGDGPE